jgi:hypothetical protein
MTRTARFLLRILWTAAPLACVVPDRTAAADVDAHRWRDRLLIVFAAGENAPALLRQRDIARQARADFSERELVTIEVVGNSVSGSDESAAALRERFGVAPHAFRVLLLGKDGGVKMVSSVPLAAGALVSTIDAMPMRREESRRSGRSE